MHLVALANFRCAGDAWYEREVEDYIHKRLTLAVSHGKDALLLEDEDEEIVGLGQHESSFDPLGSGFQVTSLRVAAIRRDRQGARLPSGERLSHVLLSALIRDALSTDREPVIFGYIAAENTRSRRMCARLGFIEDPPLESYFSPTLGRSAPYILVQQRFERT